jgi:hypothetical protein
MSGAAGWILPTEWKAPLAAMLGPVAEGFKFDDLNAFAGVRQLVWIVTLLAIAWLLPNSQEMMTKLSRLRTLNVRVRAPLGWSAFGAIAASLFLLAVINGSRGFSEFIYFNF